MKVAATADVHALENDEDRIRELFATVKDDADVLVLAGDLTDHGRTSQAESLLHGLHGIGVPVVGVLGNHDHEGGAVDDVKRILRSGGMHLLDRDAIVIDEVGFVGVKGFGGGFDNRIVRGFGEASLKAFVSESVVESEVLRTMLREFEVPRRFAVLHYAPVKATIQGEPEEIFPFLGTTRLERALDEGHATVAVHGHAHHGTLQGATAGGIPVWNVSMPVLKAAGHEKPYLVIDV